MDTSPQAVNELQRAEKRHRLQLQTETEAQRLDHSLTETLEKGIRLLLYLVLNDNYLHFSFYFSLFLLCQLSKEKSIFIITYSCIENRK